MATSIRLEEQDNFWRRIADIQALTNRVQEAVAEIKEDVEKINKLVADIEDSLTDD